MAFKRLMTLTARRVVKTGAGYDAYLSTIPLGTYTSNIAAEAACSGVLAYLRHQAEQKQARKQAREDRAQLALNVEPQTLRKGIYKKGNRYIVASPRYMGSFLTYEEAQEAQDRAPRAYKPREDDTDTDFEDRKFTLE